MSESMENKSIRERKSGVTKVVEVDSETEKAILDYFGGRFSPKEKLPLEKEKSPELDQMISQISNHLKEFSVKYGAESLNIPPENIHILDETKITPERKELIFKKLGKVFTVFSFGEQQIFIFRVPSQAINSLGLAQIISHEMLHNISFQSAELKPDQGGKMVVLPRRMGFRIMKNKPGEDKEDGEIVYFHFLDEAIITELTMRFDQEYFSKIPLIAKSEEYKTREGYQASPHEYRQEREKLNKLISELYEWNKDKFGSKEEVFDVFAKAVMTGRLLPVARLIEKTFGKGSFRTLGEKSARKASL